ncbi:MAG: tetratricopeptide repeat protein [Muribaculaceae bacterium]|nr:tetratricopeptide repeat protein [Muribaculaceae bacterium]
MKMIRHIVALLILALAALPGRAQVNAEQVTAIGRNVLSLDDYMLAIHYFNLAINAKDYRAEPYFLRALAKMKLDDFSGAERDCSTAIDRNKYMTEAYKLRGYVRQQLGRDSLAIADFEYGLTQNPKDRDFLFYKAISELNLKRYEAADSTLGSLIAANPKYYDAITARAQLRVERGDTVGALEDIDRSLAVSKTQEYPYILRAQIYSAREDWPQAIEALDEAVRLDPSRPDFYINRAFFKYKNDDYTGAMADYNETLHIDPYNSAALFNRGLLRFEVMELAQAAEDFSKVLDLDAGNFHARYNRALVYLTAQEYAKARPDLNAILKAYPRFYPAYYAMAQLLQGLGDERGAIRSMMKGDEIVRNYVKNPEKNPLDKPTIAGVANSKGHTADEEVSEEELIHRFNQLVTSEVDSQEVLAANDKYKGRVQDRETSLQPEPYFHLSMLPPKESLKAVSNYFRELGEFNSHNYIEETIYLVEDDSSMSEGEIQRAFDMVDKYTRVISTSRPKAANYIARGVSYTMLKNYESALADFNKALELMPDYTLALMGKGYASAMLMRTDKDVLPTSVSATFAQAAKVNPLLLYAWFNLGNLHYDQNDYAGAVEYYDKALELNRELGAAYYNRGLAKMQQGLRDEAFADFSKAGELGIIRGYRVMKQLR